MEKIVKDGLRDCTLILDGSECEVRFDTCFRAFAVRNDSGADVFISKSSGIIPDADGVMCVRSGGSAVFAHNDLDKNAVYLLGTGKVMVHGQQDSNNPFNFAPTFDGGVMAEGNPVQLDGLQEGIPFSEMVVSGKNLIPFPYYDGNSKTHNGITFTVNSDGTITANGTATASAKFYISTNYTIKKGIYTLSGCPQSDSNTDYVLQFATGDWSFKISDFGNGATTQIDNDINLQIFRIAISSGVVCDNLVFRPQLELGDAATAYEPSITGRELTVNVNGTDYTVTPDSNPYVIPNDIRQQDGLNVVTASAGTLNVVGVRKNAAVKKIWDEMGMDLLFDGVTSADNPAVVDLANYKFVEIHHIMIANEQTYPSNIRLSLDNYLSSASIITTPIHGSSIRTTHTEEGTVSSLYAISAAGSNMNNTKIYGIK